MQPRWCENTSCGDFSLLCRVKGRAWETVREYLWSYLDSDWLTSPQCQDACPSSGTAGGDLQILNNKHQLLLLRKATVKQFLCGLLLGLPSVYQNINIFVLRLSLEASRRCSCVDYDAISNHNAYSSKPTKSSFKHFFIYLIRVFLFLQI